MTFLSFLLATLATYRVARMLSMEEGPFSLFRSIRFWVGNKFPIRNGRQHWLDAGVNCPMCLSFWFGFALAWFVGPGSIAEYVVISLAISGAVVTLHKFFG